MFLFSLLFRLCTFFILFIFVYTCTVFIPLFCLLSWLFFDVFCCYYLFLFLLQERLNLLLNLFWSQRQCFYVFLLIFYCFWRLFVWFLVMKLQSFRSFLFFLMYFVFISENQERIWRRPSRLSACTVLYCISVVTVTAYFVSIVVHGVNKIRAYCFHQRVVLKLFFVWTTL